MRHGLPFDYVPAHGTNGLASSIAVVKLQQTISRQVCAQAHANIIGINNVNTNIREIRGSRFARLLVLTNFQGIVHIASLGAIYQL